MTNYRICLVVLLLFGTHIQANDLIENQTNDIKLKPNWSELTKNAYIENLNACEYIRQKHKWSKYKWPDENKSPKPLFAQIVELDQVKAKVLYDLKKQTVLFDKFSFEISPDLLQDDINRMINDTENAKGLIKLFAEFDNDPRSIAECISRPYLTQVKITEFFNRQQQLQEPIKTEAEKQLKQYQLTGNVHVTSAQVRDTSYVLEAGKFIEEQGNSLSFVENINDEKLNAVQFKNFHTSQKLIESERAYIYQHVYERSSNTIKAKHLTWPKRTLHDWLNSLPDELIINHHLNYAFNLSKLDQLKSASGNNSSTADNWESKYNIPTGRVGHTAVWTGTEMIVFGGVRSKDTSQSLDISMNQISGGRYNPVTDSWLPISTDNIPKQDQDGYNFTSVWTGTEMIVWNLNGHGARYNPTADSWKLLPTENAPSQVNSFVNDIFTPRSRGSVWTGNEMIVWGGIGGSRGGIYNPNSNTWHAISEVNAPDSGSGPTLVWTGSEMIVFGGKDENSNPILPEGARYNPVTDTWTAMADKPISANFGNDTKITSSTWIGDELIILHLNGSAFSSLGYNPMTDVWRVINPPSNIAGNNFQSFPSSVWTGTELYVFYLDQLFLYDPVGNNWTEVDMSGINLDKKRRATTMVWTGTELIFWGGISNDLVTAYNTGGRYNPDTDNWTVVSNVASTPFIPQIRRGHEAIWTGAEMIIWGGSDDCTSGDPCDFDHFNTGGRYNPVTDSWLPTFDDVNLQPVPIASKFYTAVWTGTEMIIWGGDNGSNTGSRYNPLTDTWLPVSLVDASSNAFSHSAVWNGVEMMVWGGIGNADGMYNPIEDEWTRIGTSGSNVAPTNFNRTTAVWTGEEMFLKYFLSNEMYRYSPSSGSAGEWLPINTVGMPGAQDIIFNTTIWTGDKVMLWGGFTNVGYLYDPVNDFWETTSTDQYTPEARFLPSATWTGSEMIIWGGAIADSAHELTPQVKVGGIYNPVSDTWLPTTTNQNAFNGKIFHSAVMAGEKMIVFNGITGDEEDDFDHQLITRHGTMGIYEYARNDLIFRDGF